MYFDTETTGLDRFEAQPVGLAIGCGGQSFYISFAHRGGGNLFDEAVARRWALSELRGKRLVGLNTKFDIHILESWGVPIREMGCTFHDVAHSEALLDDHETRFDLEHLAQKRLGRGKVDEFPRTSIADLPAHRVAPYACLDVELVAALEDHYAPLLDAEDLGRVAALEDRIIPACVELERNGLPLDMDLLERWETEARRIQEELAWQVYRECGFACNPKAPSDMKRLFTQCGAQWGITEKGGASFTKDVVMREAQKHPAIMAVWRLGKIVDLRAKTLTKYLKDAKHGKLWPAFHQLKVSDESGRGLEAGTISGRFSSSGPNGQNIQGYKQYMAEYSWLTEYTTEHMFAKQLFRPESGVWFSADKHQVELRIAADFARAKPLLDAYARDPYTDFHRTAYDLIVKVRPKTHRVEAKTTSFTRLYGGGAGTIGRRLGLTYEDALDLVEAYDQAFPEWGSLLKLAEKTATTRGYIVTSLGRRARYRKGDRTYMFANRAVQGTAADDMKLALADAYEHRKEFGLTLRATVHDELDGDIPDAASARRFREFLDIQRIPSIRVPLLWGMGTGPTWHHAKEEDE